MMGRVFLGKRLTIGLESRFLDGPSTGIANYTFHMLASALRLEPSLSYVGFGRFGWLGLDQKQLQRMGLESGSKEGNEQERKGPRVISRIVGRALLASASSPKLRLARAFFRRMRQVKFGASAQQQSLDLFHAFNFRPPSDPGVPVLPVIYDLSTFRHPEFHPQDRVRWLAPLGETIARAPMVQTISEFSKREIVSLFGYPAERIFVAPPAAASVFVAQGKEITSHELASLDLIYGQFFLAVGTLEPRKNIRTLVAAYARLTPAERAAFPLVIAGGKGWGDLKLPREVEVFRSDGSLRFLQSTTNPQLRSLYEGARLLLMPSLYEGFGMPVVEALACGTPVAFSESTAMAEIGSELGEAVAAQDVDAWTEALRRSLDSRAHADPGLRTARIARARQFDWTHSAGLVLDAYRQIAKDSAP